MFVFSGELWCWKIIVSIIPPIVTVLVGWVVLGYWIVLCWIFQENKSCSNRFLLVISLTVLGNVLFFAGFCIFSVVAGLFAEIFCFSIIAAFIFIALTANRWDYRTEATFDMINEMLDFISGAAKTHNDTIIRILCINFGYYTSTGKNLSVAKDVALIRFIQQKHLEERLNSVSYSDIRENCDSHKQAAIFTTSFEKYKKKFKDLSNDLSNAVCNSYESGRMKKVRRLERIAESLSMLLFAYVGIPIYGLSRIFTILYPYMIVFYIGYYNLLFKLDLFELTMLGVYIFLQWVTFILGFFVLRTHLWLWHILPGKRKYRMKWHEVDRKEILRETFKYYDQVQWLPFATQIVVRKFGQDIGGIVVDYLKAMNHLKV